MGQVLRLVYRVLRQLAVLFLVCLGLTSLTVRVGPTTSRSHNRDLESMGLVKSSDLSTDPTVKVPSQRPTTPAGPTAPGSTKEGNATSATRVPQAGHSGRAGAGLTLQNPCTKTQHADKQGARRSIWGLPLLDHRGLPKRLHSTPGQVPVEKGVEKDARPKVPVQRVSAGDRGKDGKPHKERVLVGLGGMMQEQAQQSAAQGSRRRKALEAHPIEESANVAGTPGGMTGVLGAQSLALKKDGAESDPWSLSKDDLELLERAAASPSSVSGVTPKLAFLFLTRGPLPLAALWARFFEGHEDLFSVYVHTAEGFDFPNRDLPGCFHQRNIPSKSTSWGTLSLIDAERRLIANALLDPRNQWFILVSESCIPLRSFPFTYSFLLNSTLSYVMVLSKYPKWLQARYARLSSGVIKHEDWRKGSQFFAIQRDVAKLVVSDKAYLEAISKIERPVGMYWDEHYLPTMLTKLVPEKLANKSLTWTRFRWRSPHPDVFGPDQAQRKVKDIKRMSTCNAVARSPTHCFLFARKFREDAIDPLLEMSEVLGY